MRYLFVALFTLFVTASFQNECHSQTPTEEPIRIGLLTDLTSMGAFWGTQARAGAEVAVKELQASGAKVELVVGNHAFDTKVAISEATKMFTIDKVDAIQIDFSSLAIAVSRSSAAQNHLLISNGAATSPLKSNPHAHKSFLDYEKGCEEIAREWKSKDVKNIGLLRPEMESGELCAQAARKVFPDAIILDYKLGVEVKTQVLKLKASGITHILNPGLELDTLNFLAELDALRWNAEVGLVEDDAITPNALKKYPKGLENAITFGFVPVTQDFIEALKKVDPKNSLIHPEAAALSYLHVKLLFDAIKDCARSDLDCQEAALAKSGATSLLNFRGWVDRVASFDFELKRWNNLKSTLIRKFH